VLIPLAVAETLRAAQLNDLRDVVRGANGKTTYGKLDSAGQEPIASGKDRNRRLRRWDSRRFRCSIPRAIFGFSFTIFDSCSESWSLALAVFDAGDCQHAGDAILGTQAEIGVLKALGRLTAT